MPDTTSTLVQSVLDLAKRKGLVPVFRTGTVLAETTDISRAMVTLDNDINPTPAYNYAGLLRAGSRVLTMFVRPHGLYVIGDAETPPNSAMSLINEAGPGGTDSTTSASFANLAGVSSFSFTKNRADTSLIVDMRASCFLTGVANTRPSFAVLVSGTDYEVVSMLVNPTSTHTTMAGVEKITGLAAGVYTVQGRWRRVSGTGTISRNADDWFTMSAVEGY